MQLPGWMKIGDKSTAELLAIWGLPALVILAIAFALWGTFGDPGNGFSF